jgi:transcriptional regulator with XRE-family HTH domain
MTQPISEDMAREHQRQTALIAQRIYDLRIKAGMDQAELGAALGQTGDAIRKMEAGQNLTAFIKLADLASALGADPNDILGFATSAEQSVRCQATLGLIEGSLMSRGMPMGEAEALARIVLEVLDSPEVRSEGTSPRDNARILARSVIRRFFER